MEQNRYPEADASMYGTELVINVEFWFSESKKPILNKWGW